VEGRGHVLIEGIILTLPGRTEGKSLKSRQDSRAPGKGFKPGSFDYETAALTNRSRRSVTMLNFRFCYQRIY
jgi:hypothetical protein